MIRRADDKAYHDVMDALSFTSWKTAADLVDDGVGHPLREVERCLRLLFDDGMVVRLPGTVRDCYKLDG